MPDTNDPDIKTFLEYSGRMMHVNALLSGWEKNFATRMVNLRTESTLDSFRRGFAKSLSGGLSPSEYEQETGWEFDTHGEFLDHLHRLWTQCYGDADPTESLTSHRPSA
ncbi:hypothetical protein KIH74_11160 [Kineosporia sp. J2-2]|uniref:Uncharacterized protein n=1 Tax=Kineosporia corallincola TaxID=2835133 RepID=A0ABS5TEH1_9ACTN|nr:hypothetical protein [Kineosporia corallincola]MBT0769482.1 hypothetical protein [Kineosporia corallincola]